MKKAIVSEGHDFVGLLKEIKGIVHKARYVAFTAVNTEMLKAYYKIGKRIVEEEQKGGKRAGYGEKLLETLSTELIKEFGRGFSVTALKNMRIFYQIYKGKIGQSATDEFFKLTWTHYCELIKIKDETKRRYFEKCLREKSQIYKITIQHSYSHSWPGLQFADLLAWAAFQKVEHNNSEFIDVLQIQQEAYNVW